MPLKGHSYNPRVKAERRPTADESPIYAGRAFVRTRRRWQSWVDWNSRLGGGPTLVVRAGSFEVSAPQGMKLESRHLVLRSRSATMWLDEIGWAGTRLGRKECIHVAAEHEGRSVELALSPRDGLDDAWQALLASGVAPTEG